MPVTTAVRVPLAGHGAVHLPSVDVDNYGLEIKDDEGFLGDRANKSAFRDMIENWRKPFRKRGEDPFGDKPSSELNRKDMDKLLIEGDAEAAGIVHAAIEDFSGELALVIRRFLKLKSWKDTERIVIGGGMRESRIGELVIGRASAILKADNIDVGLVPIKHDPDEAGLIGAAHLAAPWLFEGHDGIIAIDIGGTNIRTGVVLPNLKKATDLSKASVWRYEIWRHAEDKDKKSRDAAVDTLIGMIEDIIKQAKKEKLHLAPFIGIGCPGKINEDGSIDRGAQNLPGAWNAKSFNLPDAIHKAIPEIGSHETAIVMHNDAVVQGLSQLPFMRDVKHWGALTIGTGLGNARFSNRKSGD